MTVDTVREAVIGPDRRVWLLELRDGSFGPLAGHFFLGLILRALGRLPPWEARVVDDSAVVVAELRTPDYAVARAWLAEAARRIERGDPLP